MDVIEALSADTGALFLIGFAAGFGIAAVCELIRALARLGKRIMLDGRR